MSRADIEAGRAIVRLVVEGRQETHAMLRQVNTDLQDIKRSADSISFSPGEIIPSAVPAAFTQTAGAMALISRRTFTARREITGLRDAVTSLQGKLPSQFANGRSGFAVNDMARMMQPRTVAFSSRGQPGLGNTPRTIITPEGVFKRAGIISQFFTGGRVAAEQWNKFAKGLMEGKSVDEIGGRQLLRRAVPTARDLRSINSVYTPTGYANRAGMDGFFGRKNFTEFLRQRFGMQQTGSAMSSSQNPLASSMMPTGRPSTITALPQMAAIKNAATAAGSAAATMTAPVARAVATTDRLSKSLGNLGSGLTGIGVKMALAGAAISAAATPFLLLTNTFAKSASAVRDYAKDHKVSIAEALKKTNSELTEDQVKLGATLADSWAKLKTAAKGAWESVAASVGTALAPKLKEQVFQVQGFLSGVKQAGKAIGTWIEKNRALASTIFSAGSAMAVLGTAVAALGVSLTVGASLLATLGTVASFIISPFTLITAALAGAGYAWVSYTETGKAALSNFLQIVSPFAQAIGATIKGISDAIVAGDFRLAMSIAAAGMKLVLAEALESMRGILGESLTDMAQMVLSGDFQGAWQSLVMEIAALWEGFSELVVNSFTSTMDAVLKVTESAMGAVAKTLFETLKLPGADADFAGWMVGMKPGQFDKAMRDLEKIYNGFAATGKGQAKPFGDALGDSAKKETARSNQAYRDFLAQMDKDAKQRGARGGGAVADDGTFDLTKREKRNSAVEQYRKDLDELKKKAQGQADEQRAKGLPELDLGTRKIKSESFVTTSAAAAIASGYGMGGKANDPAERAAKAAEENVKQNKAAEKRQIERDAKIIATHEKFFASLSH